MVAAVTAMLCAAVDERPSLEVGQRWAEPDLIEQLVPGRLAGLLEPMRPRPRRWRWRRIGLGRAGLPRPGERTDQP
jgi:hypothetical protein